MILYKKEYLISFNQLLVSESQIISSTKVAISRRDYYTHKPALYYV